MDDFDFDPYLDGDDLQNFSDNEAWEDTSADLLEAGDWEGDEDAGMEFGLFGEEA